MRLHREHGFAIPLTIYVVTIATILLAVGFSRASADRRSADTTDDHVEALSIAHAGLDTYIGTVNFDACDHPIRPVDGDSVRINLNGGYADVVARVVQRPADSLNAWTYVVRSTGRRIKPSQGRDPQAVRTVAQFARWQQASLLAGGALTAANGNDAPEDDTSGEFRGRDHAAGSGCAGPDIPAIRVPSGGAPGISGDADYTLEGSIVASGTNAQVAAATKIDWASTKAGVIKADYTSLQTWDASYPIMFVAGNLTIDAASVTNIYGTLIVTGDLNLTGSSQLQLYGILLVGRRIHFEATDQRFDGLVITGLDHQLGLNSPTNKLRDGYIDIDYDSREVRRALKRLVGFVPMQNAIVDNWPSY